MSLHSRFSLHAAVAAVTIPVVCTSALARPETRRWEVSVNHAIARVGKTVEIEGRNLDVQSRIEGYDYAFRIQDASGRRILVTARGIPFPPHRALLHLTGQVRSQGDARVGNDTLPIFQASKIQVKVLPAKTPAPTSPAVQTPPISTSWFWRNRSLTSLGWIAVAASSLPVLLVMAFAPFTRLASFVRRRPGNSDANSNLNKTNLASQAPPQKAGSTEGGRFGKLVVLETDQQIAFPAPGVDGLYHFGRKALDKSEGYANLVATFPGSEFISQRHAEIVAEPDGSFLYRNNAPSNETRIDDELVETHGEVRLRHGAILDIGDGKVRLQFFAPGTPAQAPRAAAPDEASHPSTLLATSRKATS